MFIFHQENFCCRQILVLVLLVVPVCLETFLALAYFSLLHLFRAFFNFDFSAHTLDVLACSRKNFTYLLTLLAFYQVFGVTANVAMAKLCARLHFSFKQ